MQRWTRFWMLAAMVFGLLTVTGTPSRADTSAEAELAEKFAPVMMLVTQKTACGPGEPYRPSNVDVVFDNPTVALRGPWRPQRDLVKVGPSMEDVSKGLPGYALDLPGDPLNPGCEYEKWARSVWGSSAEPAAYAHVATQTGVSNRIALQYYFFYPFNDYNNKHETDWERIQLEFEAPDAATALSNDVAPDLVVYSQHYGSERAGWDDDKLEIVDDTHPVVYVSAGSHANQFSAGVFLGNSAVTGFGCDITAGDHTELRPVIETIPSNTEEAREAFPWVSYRGHWGEVGPVRFYEGPTGPNRKTAWTRPFVWSADARSSSIVVPGSAASNTGVSQFYCSALGKGSDLFRSYVDNAPAVLAVLAILIGLLVWLLRRTDWDSRPTPLAQHRRSGQIVNSSWQMLKQHPLTFLLIVLPMVVLNVAAAGLQTAALVSNVPRWLVAGVDALAVLSLLLSAGAVTVAMSRLGKAQSARVGEVYVEGARRLAVGAPAIVVAVVSLLLLTTSIFLAPVALVLLGAWSLLISVIVLERRSGFSSLRRSLSLVWRSLGTTLPVLLLMLLLITAAGALLATLLFVITALPFIVLNMVPPLTLVLVWPFTCVMATYNYFSAAEEVEEHRAAKAASQPAT